MTRPNGKERINKSWEAAQASISPHVHVFFISKGGAALLPTYAAGLRRSCFIADLCGRNPVWRKSKLDGQDLCDSQEMQEQLVVRYYLLPALLHDSAVPIGRVKNQGHTTKTELRASFLCLTQEEQ